MGKTRILTAKERLILDRIETVINKQGLAWSALSKMVGKSENLGSQWSSRRACPVQRDIVTIASALGIDMAWLLTGNEPAELRLAQTETELALLNAIRALPVEQQEAVLAGAQAMRDRLNKK